MIIVAQNEQERTAVDEAVKLVPSAAEAAKANDLTVVLACLKKARDEKETELAGLQLQRQDANGRLRALKAEDSGASAADVAAAERKVANLDTRIDATEKVAKKLRCGIFVLDLLSDAS